MRMLSKAAATAALGLLTAACVPVAANPSPADGSDLARLRAAAESDPDGYARAAFGQRWKDIDHDGCDQRNDVLARDLTDVQRRGRCVVVAGVLVDPYTGERVVFRKADAQAVQIDHVVSLAEAWRSGAASWPESRREQLANDLDELAASSASSNREKSDKDASDWRPVGSARGCTYARRVITIKARYGLTVDLAERRGLAALLAECQG